MKLHAVPPAFRALAPAALLVSAVLAGCSGSPGPVARVGTEFITVEQFQDAARGNEGQYNGPPDTAKTALLQDLVRRRLMVQEARRRHLIPDTTLERMRRQETERLAPEVLIQRMVPRDAQVSDAEVDEFYKRRMVQAHMTLVLVFTKSEIDRAKADLDRGEDFAAVANRYNSAGMLPSGGDLGFMAPGSLLEPLDQYLFDGPIGKLLGPDEIKGQGWTIAKVLERKPREQPPLAEQKTTLESMIRQRKLRAAQQDAYYSLRDQYHVKLEPGAGQELFRRFNPVNPAQPPGAPPAPSPPADSAGESRVLARYDGEGGKPTMFTVADAEAVLHDPTQQRPNNTSVPLLEHWVELQAVRRVTVIEAGRRHLTEDAEVQRRAEERINNILLDRLYGEVVAARVNSPDSADVQAAYHRRANAFIRIDSARFLSLTVRDSATAAELADQARRPEAPAAANAPNASPAASPANSAAPAKGLRALAAKLPAGAATPVTEREVRYPTQASPWKEVQPMVMGMSPGDVRGPIKSGSGWVLFELVSKQQGPQPYASLPPPLQHALEQEATEMKRDRRLTQFTDSLRTLSKVEIFEQRLKQIPWPVPSAAS